MEEPMSNVLITGANRGIGLALANVYARRGDSVFACCRTPAKAEALQALAKDHSVIVLSLDVGNDESVAALPSLLATAPVDILINNAGVNGGPGEQQTAASMNFAAWAEALHVNSMGPVRVLQALLPALKRSRNPKVMSITSQLGAISFDMAFALGYSASKAALNKFMRLAAIELKPEGIAVGLVHPGWVKTDMGGPGAAITPEESAAGIAKVIDELSLENTGAFWKWNGSRHEW
jgi:NAD(P)-dependent dehydrogenase (short-subunit alcohol dehydrogenase family)